MAGRKTRGLCNRLTEAQESWQQITKAGADSFSQSSHLGERAALVQEKNAYERDQEKPSSET